MGNSEPDFTLDPELDFTVTLGGGRGPAGHPTRDEIRLLSPDFYANFDELTQ